MKKIEKLTYCIQCTEKITGKVGDFVYHEDNPLNLINAIEAVLENLPDPT